MSVLAWGGTYLAALAAFLVIDLTWLGWLGAPIYQREMGEMMLERPRWGAAGAFYAIYVAGLLFFAVRPVLADPGGGTLAKAALMGAAFGFITYATFDLTTLAVIKGFNARIALIDMVWGTVLGAAVATVGYLAAGRLS